MNLNAELYFKVELGYDRTTYPALKRIALLERYSFESKMYEWWFSMADVERVEAVTGLKILVDKKGLARAFKYSGLVIDEVSRAPYKGEGLVDILELPNLYIVTTFQRKQKVTYRIPKSTVEVVWAVVKSQPKFKPVKTSTIAGHYCEVQGYARFFRETGSFNWEKFFGTRSRYFQFYYSLKVLQEKGVVKHYKWGAVERLKDEFSQQARISMEVEV